MSRRVLGRALRCVVDVLAILGDVALDRAPRTRRGLRGALPAIRAIVPRRFGLRAPHAEPGGTGALLRGRVDRAVAKERPGETLFDKRPSNVDIAYPARPDDPAVGIVTMVGVEDFGVP
jgi:hypothetical protein